MSFFGPSPARLNLIGQTFGWLTVVADDGVKRGPSGAVIRYWACDCICGKRNTKTTGQLRSGHAKSCGCAIAIASKKRSKHKFNGTRPPEYGVWRAMRRRCKNKKCADYIYYGARGISVCKRWDDYQSFIRDMGLRPSAKHSIDRINNEGNYEPGNCRWATPQEQRRNRRDYIKNHDHQ